MGSQQEEWLETPYTWLFLTNTLDFSATTIAFDCLVEEGGTLIWCQYNIRIIPRPQTNEILAHAHRTWRQNRIGLCRDLTQILYWCQIRKSHGLAGTEFERKKMPGWKSKQNASPTNWKSNKQKQTNLDPLKRNEERKCLAGAKGSNGLHFLV